MAVVVAGVVAVVVVAGAVAVAVAEVAAMALLMSMTIIRRTLPKQPRLSLPDYAGRPLVCCLQATYQVTLSLS